MARNNKTDSLTGKADFTNNPLTTDFSGSNIVNHCDLSHESQFDLFTINDYTSSFTFIYKNETPETYQLDYITDSSGFDMIMLGNEDDVIWSQFGGDHIFTMGGDDKIWGNYDGQMIRAGTGDDYVYANGGNDYVWGDAGNDELHAGNGNDRVYGGEGNDYITGYHGNDRLFGDNGCDEIYGGSGNDKIFGGNGHDLLEGGNGNDLLVGGADADVFIFQSFPQSTYATNHDVVKDFNAAEDAVAFSYIVAEFELYNNVEIETFYTSHAEILENYTTSMEANGLLLTHNTIEETSVLFEGYFGDFTDMFIV